MSCPSCEEETPMGQGVLGSHCYKTALQLRTEASVSSCHVLNALTRYRSPKADVLSTLYFAKHAAH